MKKEFLTRQPPDPSVPVRVYPNYLRSVIQARQYQERNKGTEIIYHSILKSVKELYSKLPTDAERTYFEVNRKQEMKTSIGMHDFMISGFYWILECDHWYQYWIYYKFENCPFQEQIEKMFLNSGILSSLKVMEFKEPYKDYLAAVLKCQDEKFIKTLNPVDLD